MRAVVPAALLLLLCGSAYAATVEIRPDRPIAEFSIPDDWKTSHIKRGIQAVSSDKEVYFWIEAYAPSDFKTLIAEHNAYWKQQGVDITSSDEQKHNENGKEVAVTTEHATWNGEPTVLYYVEYRLGLPSNSNIVVTYWASPEGDKAFQKQVGDVLGSLTITEK
jgi:hypothetical protein